MALERQANGHPLTMAGISVHWDGDLPLFTTSASGSLTDVKVETLGYVLANGRVISIDRDGSGIEVSEHDNTGRSEFVVLQGLGGFDDIIQYGGYAIASPNHGPTPNFKMAEFAYQPPGTASTLPQYVQIPRLDGISIGGDVIQGVRAYDPGTNTWSTPDAYAGAVHDPTSQKAYMWNRNNPYSYSDPSGYCAEDLCVGEAGVVVAGGETVVGGILRLVRQRVPWETGTLRMQRTPSALVCSSA